MDWFFGLHRRSSFGTHFYVSFTGKVPRIFGKLVRYNLYLLRLENQIPSGRAIGGSWFSSVQYFSFRNISPKKMNVENIYTRWNQAALDIAENKVESWKRNSKELLLMLEHVSQEYAQVYLTACFKELNQAQILEYVKMCDAIGNPQMIYFQELDTMCSPTSLRYLYHALCILQKPIDLPIVEVGGGYGGLAVAIDFVSKVKGFSNSIREYVIIDFPNVQKLQDYYLKQFSLSFPVSFYGQYTQPCYFISNYCLGEMGEENRQYYFTNLVLPYAQAGFLVWNSNQSYSALERKFNVQVQDEIPQTGPNNKFIRFQLF
jgi:hypothetical protein